MKAFSDTIWTPGQPLEPTQKALRPQELTDRLMYLEKLVANPSLDQIDVAALKRNLEQTWLPEGSTLLSPGSVSTDSLGVVPHIVLGKATQNIANAAFTVNENIVWDTVFQPNTGMWSAASADVRATAPGIYLITASGWFGGGAGGRRILAIFINGAEPANVRRTDVAPSAIAGLITTLPYRLNLNDLVQIRCYQDSGGILAITQGMFTMTWIGNA